jgi:thioredoxin 1
MAQIINITTAQFPELTKAGRVLVDFWSPTCGPCRMQGKILEEMAADKDLAEVKFLKVNVYEEMDLAVQFQVNAIPMLLVFKDGAVTKSFVGVQSAETIKEAVLA